MPYIHSGGSVDSVVIPGLQIDSFECGRHKKRCDKRVSEFIVSNERKFGTFRSNLMGLELQALFSKSNRDLDDPKPTSVVCSVWNAHYHVILL